jgi:hypothetical protein
MTEKADKAVRPIKPNQRPPPRPSYEKVVENIDRWIHSSGLQKPT